MKLTINTLTTRHFPFDNADMDTVRAVAKFLFTTLIESIVIFAKFLWALIKDIDFDQTIVLYEEYDLDKVYGDPWHNPSHPDYHLYKDK